jgi:hypothetical protein
MGVLTRSVSSVALLGSTFLMSCGGGGSGTTTLTFPNYTLTVSPQPASVAAGGTVTFTATTNSPTITWGLVNIAGTATIPPTNAGSPTSQSSGTTFVYTAPITPPIYGTNIQTAGTVDVRALAGLTDVDTTFTITAPTITTGFYPPVSTSVALGSTLIVNAYAVGAVNNAITLQANGTTGGSSSVGTILAPAGALYGEYIYTAPATMPVTGSAITLTAISQADPTQDLHPGPDPALTSITEILVGPPGLEPGTNGL